MAESLSELYAKLYLDEDVHKVVARGLRMRGYDVVSAHEVKQIGLSDAEQLAYAISEGRAMVTFNVADYIKLHNNYLASGKRHYGIILSEQRSVGEMIRRLAEFLNRFPADEVGNNLWWL